MITNDIDTSENHHTVHLFRSNEMRTNEHNMNFLNQERRTSQGLQPQAATIIPSERRTSQGLQPQAATIITTNEMSVGQGFKPQTSTLLYNAIPSNLVDLLKQIPSMNENAIRDNFTTRLLDDKNWEAIPKLKDANLKNRDVVEHWISQLNGVIQAHATSDWYKGNWSALAKYKLDQNAKTILALVEMCRMQLKSWEDFQRELKALVTPESTTASSHMGNLLTKLQENHNAYVEVDLLQKYLEHMFKAAKLRMEAEVSMTPEMQTSFWNQVSLFHKYYMESVVLDAQMSFHKDHLVNWDNSSATT